jgi:hypothetical protein
MKMASASGSCSACATRSEAISFAVAAFAGDDDLRGAGEHVDGAIKGDEALGRSDVEIAGADDLVNARNGSGAIGQRGDGVRAAEAIELRDAERCAAASVSGAGLGETTAMRSTPATCAGIAVISSVEGSG